MKACPVCGRLYPLDAGFCPTDGQQLVSATQAPIASADGDARIGALMCSRYQVRRVVADGGMGRVYEALDMQERRNVALKILHPDVATDAVALERFKREFEVSKLLPHDHIVDVIDFQPTHDGSYALVMEFLYGEELRATLKREGVMPPERVIRMVSQIALALDEPHARKLVHRDLKPDNVFLCQTREGDIVKILDFGSVKDKSDPTKKLTVMGTTIGSPYYMAPEQAMGLETLDHRADVWALAAITYESLVGTVPFKGANGPSILLEILQKEPTPPSNATKDKPNPVPPTVDRVMIHAFKKNPAVRIASVGAFADSLGLAYGLQGNHRDWAKTPQDELGRQVAAKLPEMMQSAGQATRDISDAFFGESEALAVAPDPFGSPSGPQPSSGLAPSTQVSPQFASNDADIVPMGVPKSSSAMIVLALAVGGVALLLGIVIVVVLSR
jgi:serine/threonine protein kinase